MQFDAAISVNERVEAAPHLDLGQAAEGMAQREAARIAVAVVVPLIRPDAGGIFGASSAIFRSISTIRGGESMDRAFRSAMKRPSGRRMLWNSRRARSK